MIEQGNAVEWANSYSGEPFHALLCDPPYHLTQNNIRNAYNPTPGLSSWDAVDEARKQARSGKNAGGFMGKQWDGGDVAFNPDTWAAFLKIMYPGAFGMAFASSRGWHRLACAIEDAGFVIHPSLFGWSYGSGFPKATRVNHGDPHTETFAGHRYGLQALKPALEPIIVFQRPYEGRPIENITRTGAGVLNVDGGRIGTGDDKMDGGCAGMSALHGGGITKRAEVDHTVGRWPANFLLLDDEAARRLDEQSGEIRGVVRQPTGHGILDPGTGWNQNSMTDTTVRGYSDSGGASRFFFRVREQLDEADPVRYQAKASRSERDAGLEGMPLSVTKIGAEGHKINPMTGREVVDPPRHNPHPTVKPLALAKYLATLLLPPAEYAPRRIFVPFAGVASECIGSMQAGWEEVVGVELTEEYIPIARARVEYWSKRQLEMEFA